LPKALRRLWLPLLFSLLASAVGIYFYKLPLGTLPLANRVEDFDLVNNMWLFGVNSGLFEKLHIPAVDVNRTNDDIRLIEIDEESIGNAKAGLGEFPFPRSVWGKMLVRLHQAGARVVAFDIVFLDPPPYHADDVTFVQGLEQQPTVLPYTLNITSGGNIGVEPIEPFVRPHTVAQGFSSQDNPGGQMLYQALAISAGGQDYVSFAAAMVEAYTGKKIGRSGVNTGYVGDQKIPLANGNLFLLPFTAIASQDISQRVGAAVSKPVFVQSLSFADAYTEPIPDLSAFVKGRIVFIGATAQALGDFINTPFGKFPGVYGNLRIVDQLLTGTYITAAPNWLSITLMIVIPFCMMLLIMQTKHATTGAAISIGAIVVYFIVACLLYATRLYWLNVMHVTTSMLTATLLVTINRVSREAAERRMVTNLFGMHVSPAIVNDILSAEDPTGALALKGKKVKATIFYSDIRGFTAMSENMTPEEIYNQLNEYFEEMCKIIFEYGGYVDKFIGDCVMAVFSAPYQTPHDAENAVRSAVAQQKKILELAEKWKAQGKRPFTVGMGVNTGDVVMGNLGASSRMNYTVIGDNVNLAARLYNVAKAGEIIISDYTYQEVKDFVVATPMEPVMVKGKKDPIMIYNITDIIDSAQPATNGAVTTEAAPA
jgi:adenylate cyclase